MARSMYQFAIVERGKEREWRDFWERGKGRDPGRTVLIKADNQKKAETLARSQNPGCTLMSGGRIGNA